MSEGSATLPALVGRGGQRVLELFGADTRLLLELLGADTRLLLETPRSLDRELQAVREQITCILMEPIHDIADGDLMNLA